MSRWLIRKLRLYRFWLPDKPATTGEVPIAKVRWGGDGLKVLGWAAIFAGSALALYAGTSNGAWMQKVPPRDHERVSPYHGQADAVAAGHRVFVDHCAHCHGDDAEGTKKRPSLKTERVQQDATEGDLHWLLVNGSVGHGMPSWAKLGDPQIWQVIAYVRSLH